MNEPIIEKLLRKAPVPKAPAGLEEKLVGGIRLARGEPRGAELNVPLPWFRRWRIELAFGAGTLACLVVIVAQANQLSDLKRESETLRAQTQDLAALRAANAELQRLRNENAELDRLRKDSAEVQSLREKIAQLRAQSDGLAKLRAENQRLRSIAPDPQEDFFAAAKQRHDRIRCVNNLKQLGVALRVWANNHNGQFPADFISMTNEMGGSMELLQCPGDKSRHVTNWAQVRAGDVSYQMSAAGLSVTNDSNIIVFECPEHHIIGLLDGSVQQLSEERYKNAIKTIDGRRIFAPQIDQ